MADYKSEINKKFSFLEKDKSLKEQLSQLEKLVTDKYRRDGVKEVSISKDAKERAAFVVAYQNAAEREIEKNMI